MSSVTNGTTPQQLTPFGYALAGALGGVFSNAIVYPLDTVKTRIQATSSSTSSNSKKGKDDGAAVKGKDGQVSIIKVLLRIFRKEGALAFYNGFGASMLNTFSTQYAYFFFYSLVRGAYLKRITKAGKKASIGTVMELLLGAIAGALAQIFTIPVSVIATRQQIGHIAHASSKESSSTTTATSDGPAPSSPSEVSSEKPSFSAVADPSSSAKPDTASKTTTTQDNSFLAVGREIIEKEGVTGLWLGLKPSLVLTVNPAITYGVFERVKGLMVLAKEKAGSGGKLSPWESFLVGALSKTLATVVTYPYIMAKVRIQAGGASSEEEALPQPATSATVGEKDTKRKKRDTGAVSLLRSVLRDEGFLGWYRGMGAQVLKAVLSQALLFMSKEQFEGYALAIMLWQAHLRAGAAAKVGGGV